MNRIFLSLIFILIALLTVSSACAASDFDNNIDVIGQQDIADDISNDVIDQQDIPEDINIDENVEPLDDDTANDDAIVDNYTEVSDEIPMNDAIIDNNDNANDDNIIVNDNEMEEGNADDSGKICPIESNSSKYLNSWIDDTINILADGIVENLTRDAIIPDVDVHPINITIEILGPTFNTAMYYYAYWTAYKDYFGVLGLGNSIKAITALIHQSYGSLATLEILNAIFELDPSISLDDGGSSGYHPNVIV